MKKLNHFSEICDLYNTFIIDLWGVMHNGILLNHKAIGWDSFTHWMPMAQKLIIPSVSLTQLTPEIIDKGAMVI